MVILLCALERKRFSNELSAKRFSAFCAVSKKFRGRRPTGFRKIARAAETRKGFSVGRADL